MTLTNDTKLDAHLYPSRSVPSEMMVDELERKMRRQKGLERLERERERIEREHNRQAPTRTIEWERSR